MNLPLSPERSRTNVGLTAACMFSLALACYLLSFSGLPISDDEELYASAARNLAVNGKLSAEQLYGNLRLAGSYHGVEPAFPALVSVWYRLFLRSSFGHLQTLYLFPALCTALAVALVVIIAAQLGSTCAVEVAAAALYAFSSMAWPYAKTLFREPLIALLLLSSLSVFLWLVHEGRRFWPSLSMTVVLLLLLVALTLTRVTMAAAAFALFMALPLVHPAMRGSQKRVALLAFAGMALLLLMAVFLASARASDANVFYRYSGAFIQDAVRRLITIPHSHLLEALLAPVISPWKGVLFYSPVCVLGVVGLARTGQQRPALFMLTAAVFLALLLIQALAYDAEWWTPTWGSRFLVPVIPLLVLASLPVLERLIRAGGAGWIALGCLFAAGFTIQLPAVLFNSSEFTAASYEQAPSAFPQTLIWSIARSPIIAQWQSAASQAPDLLLWRTAAARPGLVSSVCLFAFGAILVASLGLLRVPPGLRVSARSTALFLSSCLIMLSAAAVALLKVGMYDPAYEMRAFEPMCTYITGHLELSDVMIVQPYPGPAWQYLMNSECGQRVWYSLPYDRGLAPGPGLDVRHLAAALITQRVATGGRYWLIQQFWSEGFRPEQASLAPAGDPLLEKAVFTSPYRIFAGLYRRGTSK